jgi:putative transposase
MSKGEKVADGCRKIGVPDVAFHVWRKLYGGMQASEAKRFEEIDKENARLRMLVADRSLDNAIWEEVSQGNCKARRRDSGQWSACARYSVYRSDAFAGYQANSGPPRDIGRS